MTPPPAKKKKPRSKTRRGPRISRVYTRSGDEGLTGLVGGRRVKKDHPRIEAYGTVDELQVAMGRALAEAHEAGEATAPLGEYLEYIQNLLFTLGGELATRREDRWAGMPVVMTKNTRYLERLIDAYNAELPPLKDFVLPGGGAVTLALHECRVVCRRAERRIQTLAEVERLRPQVLPFVNRLSDLFFVWARWAARMPGGEAEAEEKVVPEVIWDRNRKAPKIPRG